MIRFSFKKKTAGDKADVPGAEASIAPQQSPLDVETLLLKKEREREKNKPKVQSPAERADDRRQFLSEPFAVHNGNDYSQISRDPNAQSSEWSFAHHSTLGNDDSGNSIASSLRAALDHPTSGYEKVHISPDQYAHDEKLTKLAPKGMTGYKLKANQTRTDSEPLRQYHSILNNGLIRGTMRSNTSKMPALNAPAFEPTHPLNLIATHGGSFALRKMFTDQISHVPAAPGEDKCVCGKPAHMHVDDETANAHFNATGEHLEQHEYIPQNVYDEQGNPTRGSTFRAAQSPLRYGSAITTDENGKRVVRRTKMDEGTGSDQIPVVRVGSQPVRLKIVDTDEITIPGKTQQINKFEQAPAYSYKKCKNHNCHDGQLDLTVREYKTGCGDCAPGNILRKEKNDNDGNVVLEPYAVGMGSGKLRMLNLDDAPKCPHCDNGYKISNDKTSTSSKVPCTACKATGKRLDTLSKGTSCPNCESNDSSILTTPSNGCPDCKGTGYEKDLTPVERSKAKLIYDGPDCKECSGKGKDEITKSPCKSCKGTGKEHTIVEGNPLYLMPFRDESSSTLTGIDGWKAHPNPKCTRCHGKGLMTEDGLPCNCQIGSSSNKDDLIAPPNVRLIGPNYVDVPAHLYEESMRKAYPKNVVNPHQIRDLSTTKDARTGLTPAQKEGLGRRIYLDNGSEIKNYQYAWENGVSFPQSKIDELNKKSAEHWARPDAKFTAASADLEEIRKAISSFKDLPNNISTDAYDRFAELHKNVQNTEKTPTLTPTTEQPVTSEPKVEVNK